MINWLMIFEDYIFTTGCEKQASCLCFANEFASLPSLSETYQFMKLWQCIQNVIFIDSESQLEFQLIFSIHRNNISNALS